MTKINLDTDGSTDVSVPSSSRSQGRSVAADAFGNVVTGYVTDSAVKFKVSDDLGTSFGPETKVSSASSAQADINKTNGDILFLYETDGDILLKTFGDKLTGYGLTVSRASVDFGDVSEGTSSGTESVTVTNETGSDVAISSVSTTSPFSVSSNDCPSTLGDTESCTVDVTFSPSSTGPFTEDLEIATGQPNSPRTVGLQGDGTESPNTAPTMTAGSSTSLAVDEDASTTSLSSQLEVDDPDDGQTLEWTVVSAPSNGTLSGFSTTASSGTGVQPSGVTYAPNADVSGSDSFDIQVADGNGGTATITVNVTINNLAPAFNSASSTSFAENGTGTALDVNADNGGDGTDDDGVDYTITGGADGGDFTLDTSTGELSFTSAPDFENPTDGDTNNEYVVEVTADDGKPSNNTTAQTITVDVTDINEAPAVSLGPASGSLDENNGPPNAVTAITIRDDALGSNTLSLSGADASVFQIDGSDLEFTETADFESKSSYEVAVEVDDPSVGADPDDSEGFSLSIDDVNDAPTISGLSDADATIGEGETLTARLSASSGDFGQALTSLDMTGVPEDARDFIVARNSVDGGLADTDTLTTDSLEVEFTPDNSFVTTGGGTRTVALTVRAEDQKGTVVDSTFAVAVNDVNRAPAITEALPNSPSGPDTTVADGQLLEQVYHASDPDGQRVSLSLTQSPSGMDFSFSTTTPTSNMLAWTPTFSQAGHNGTDHFITVEASDVPDAIDSTATVEVVFDRLVGDVDGSGGVPGGLVPGDSGFKDPSGVGPGDAFRALEVAVGKSELSTPGALNNATIGDPEIRASDCAPLADPSDPSQGCGGNDPQAADRNNVRVGDAFAVLQVAVSANGSQNAALASASSKAGSASGEIQIGELEVKDGRAALPVVLSENASGVTSAEVTLELDEGASLASVSDRLPDGWQVASHVQEDGTLKLGMFGPSALPGGKIATLQVDLGGAESVDGLEGHYRINTSDQRDLELQTAPSEFKLMGNYPNPVDRSTTIEYQLKEARPVTVRETQPVRAAVYDVLGREVAVLHEGTLAGQAPTTLRTGRTLPAGTYFVRVRGEGFTATERLTVVR